MVHSDRTNHAYLNPDKKETVQRQSIRRELAGNLYQVLGCDSELDKYDDIHCRLVGGIGDSALENLVIGRHEMRLVQNF